MEAQPLITVIVPVYNVEKYYWADVSESGDSVY